MADTLTPEQFEAWLDGVASAVEPAVLQASLDAAHFVNAHLARNIRTTFQPGTGDLSASFKVSAIAGHGGGAVGAQVMSDLVYAGIQNDGGTILPKRTYLAIPAPWRRNKPEWPRDLPRGFLKFIKSKAGNPLLVEDLGKGGFRVHFILKKHVTLTGRHYLERTQEATAGDVALILADAYMGVMK